MKAFLATIVCMKEFDLCIIGGGINGCGIAADAAGRGLSVLLCEQEDLASGTSSKSSKLIHGGLRYLEYREFRLVREALKEREILLKKAPHLIKELRFILPHEKHLRAKWMLRLGLLLYDHLASRKTIQGSKKVSLKRSVYGTALQSRLKTGFIYSDCWVDDARLVVSNAIAAKQHGAEILTHTQCKKAVRENGRWTINLTDQHGSPQIIHARALVNAAGPWVSEVIHDVLAEKSRYQAKLVKGSHIVVPKLYQGSHAYILQNNDNRIVFAIPYQDNLTMIGTTDEAFSSDPHKASITAEETAYLCEVIDDYFNKKIHPNDVVWSFSGVRPLHDEGSENLSALSRDYALEYSEVDQLPLINIFGGKITTYRQLAEHALAKLEKHFPAAKPAWTADRPLPGGEFDGDFDTYFQALRQQYNWLPEAQIKRYCLSYGSMVPQLLARCRSLTDLGEYFGADLYQREVDYLVREEWAQTADDILWRRSKLGLRFSPQQVAGLCEYLKEKTNKM
jgi:glycerol-3-phosphate dehydrogenase